MKGLRTVLLVMLIVVFTAGTLVAQEKVLDVGINQEPDGWGAMFSMAAAVQVEGMMDIGLLYRDQDWDLREGSALYRPSIEEQTWVVHEETERMRVHWKMRDDVYWHDGTKHTIHDYVFGHEVQLDTDIPIVSRVVARRVTDIEVINDYEAYVYWDELYPFADQSFAGADPLPKHILEDVYREDKEAFIEHPYWSTEFVGKGPYKMVEWVPGSHIELEKNEDFFLGEPNIDRIFVRFIEDTETMSVQIRTGEVDVTLNPNVPFDRALSLVDEVDPEEVHIEFTPAVAWEHIDVNVRDNELLAKQNIRKGLLHALDREELVEVLFEGELEVAHTPLAPSHPLYTEDVRDAITTYDYDPEKAKEYFAKEGFTPGPDGVMTNDAGDKLVFNYRTTAGNRPRELTQQVLADQWSQVGVKVEIDNRPPGVLFDPQHFYRREWPGMIMFAWVSYPTTLPSMWHSDQIPTEENGWSGQNVAGWSNPRADELVSEIEETLSEEKRQELAVELFQIWTEELPSLPIRFDADMTSWKTNVEGIMPTGSADPDTWNIWEWDIVE